MGKIRSAEAALPLSRSLVAHLVFFSFQLYFLFDFLFFISASPLASSPASASFRPLRGLAEADKIKSVYEEKFSTGASTPEIKNIDLVTRVSRGLAYIYRAFVGSGS